ncbi:hypothetical protein GCM10011504_46830 [Siccirubricoccus deserti]|nr:hypothetical protein GCM10011504_46830 [Siccirubricoccus deserti]
MPAYPGTRPEAARGAAKPCRGQHGSPVLLEASEHAQHEEPARACALRTRITDGADQY